MDKSKALFEFDKKYGRIINLGVNQGVHKFTFTAKDDFDQYTLPSDNYLKTIIEGLRETHNISDVEIVEYLGSALGIYGRKSREDLEELVKREFC